MGTDIHIHLEYRSRKKRQYQYGGELSGARCYGIFNTMAGEEVTGAGDGLFPLRGLPGDVTQATYKDFIDRAPDAHHPSWLTTNEFAACIVEAYIRLYSLEELQLCKEYEDLIMKLRLLSGIKQGDVLMSYKKILELMLSYEKDGESCRIVFWFDN
jgi:hypothetical protein